MKTLTRYLYLWLALARYGLIREMTFRGNFLIKVTVEGLWLAVLLIFYQAVFSYTSVVATWSQSQYLFYVGCHFALLSVLEAMFLGNCGEFAELIRTGNLDFYLLKPIDEQFLVTCRNVDWSVVPSFFMGIAVMIVALNQLNWEFDVVRLVLFVAVFVCGVAIAYSFLLMLTASSVWLVRNQSLYEVWWLFSTLIRFPRDIFLGTSAEPIGVFFTFVVPIMLVINVPASTLVKVLEPGIVAFTVVVSVVLLFISRRIFRAALRTYRSASS